MLKGLVRISCQPAGVDPSSSHRGRTPNCNEAGLPAKFRDPVPPDHPDDSSDRRIGKDQPFLDGRRK